MIFNYTKKWSQKNKYWHRYQNNIVICKHISPWNTPSPSINTFIYYFCIHFHVYVCTTYVWICIWLIYTKNTNVLATRIGGLVVFQFCIITFGRFSVLTSQLLVVLMFWHRYFWSCCSFGIAILGRVSVLTSRLFIALKFWHATFDCVIIVLKLFFLSYFDAFLTSTSDHTFRY